MSMLKMYKFEGYIYSDKDSNNNKEISQNGQSQHQDASD